MGQHHPLGQFCALMTAVAWAMALVLFKRSGERVGPLALNLFKNAVGLVLLVLTLVVTRDGLAAVAEAPRRDICILLISGVIGISLADTLLFAALNRVGVGLLSIADCTYSPSVILLSFLLLGERLTGVHYLGAGLIVCGVVVASRAKPPLGRTRWQVISGMGLAVLSMATMAYGIVLAKPVLEGFPLMWATTLRLAIGTFALAVWALVSSRRRELWAVFRPSTVWKASIPASILGTYVSLLLWMAGFKYTHASVAALLNQTSVVFAMVLATAVLKEDFGRRKLAAVVLTLAGAVVVWRAQL